MRLLPHPNPAFLTVVSSVARHFPPLLLSRPFSSPLAWRLPRHPHPNLQALRLATERRQARRSPAPPRHPILIRLRPFMEPLTDGTRRGTPQPHRRRCMRTALVGGACRPSCPATVHLRRWIFPGQSPLSFSHISLPLLCRCRCCTLTHPPSPPKRCTSPALGFPRAVPYAKRQLSVAVPAFAPFARPSNRVPSPPCLLAIDTTEPSRSPPPSALIHCTPSY